MSPALLAAALTGVVGAGAGLLAPRVIGRLREPEPERPPESEQPEPERPPEPDQPEPEMPSRQAPTYLEVSRASHLAPGLALAGVVVGSLVGWHVGWTPVLAAWAYLVAVCLPLGYVDARTRLLPTQLIAPSYGVVVVLLLAAGILDRDSGELRGAFLGWLVMGGFYFVMWQVGPRGLGYGDVRLSGLLALCLGFLGWGVLVTGLYAGFLLGGTTSLVLVLARRVDRKTQIPFGPFMMLGALAGLVWGHSLSHWYLAR